LNFQYGVGNSSTNGDSLGRNFGRSMELSLGHIVSRGMVAGFQAETWNDTEKDSILSWTVAGPDTVLRGTGQAADLNRHVQILAMTVTFPLERGLYVRGGGGICRVRQEFLYHFPLYFPPGHNPAAAVGVLSETHTVEDVGFAVVGAGGWEYKLRPHLGGVIDIQYARYVAAHIGENLIRYNAGLSYYW
jgi:hypothetical protein